MMYFDQSNICEPPTDLRKQEFAEEAVYAYTVDELEERIPEWYHAQWNDGTVHDQFWTDANEFMSDEELDDCWEQIVADKSVYRLVLAYLIARKGHVWESFLGYYADKEGDADDWEDDYEPAF